MISFLPRLFLVLCLFSLTSKFSLSAGDPLSHTQRRKAVPLCQVRPKLSAPVVAQKPQMLQPHPKVRPEVSHRAFLAGKPWFLLWPPGWPLYRRGENDAENSLRHQLNAVRPRIASPGQYQSWALSVFLNFFNNKK